MISLPTTKFSVKSQAKGFDEVEHISYANVFSTKCTMPVGRQSSQKQYKALSIHARVSAAVNISLTWPWTEPCVFSITSRYAAFMDRSSPWNWHNGAPGGLPA